MGCAVVFGGAGFIGSFLSVQLVKSGLYEKIYIYDVEPIARKPFPFRKAMLGCHPSIVEVTGDLRSPILWTPPEPVDLIANFAAIHREPGHETQEYFETNLKGAENVCAWAERVNCCKLIFTSSISPYGVSESIKDESTLPVPVTAYGASKLVAEKIHLQWQTARPTERRLVIVRPGVVFGPGEGGNVTRLVKGVLRGYFCYVGNKGTRKAGIYVKELCNAMLWVLQKQETSGENVSLFNGSMNPGPSIEEYVLAVCRIAGIRRYVPNIPYSALLSTAYLIDALAKPFGIEHPFSPVRIRKLVRSNNILPNYLLAQGYPFKYSLEGAMDDWRKSCPAEWQ